MTRRFLITGTDTGVGKTTLACALARAFRSSGMRVGVMKPAETGCAEVDGVLQPADAIALSGAADCSDPLELVCRYRYRAPLAPAAAAEADRSMPPELGRIAVAFERIVTGRDVVLVEGAGGIAVPLTWRENYADLAMRLGLEVIVVVANRLGCINATILTLDYAARRHLRLRGYVLNETAGEVSPAGRTNAASLARLTDVPCLGQLAFGASSAVQIARNLLQ
jgi:dethiobiotin synthetase